MISIAPTETEQMVLFLLSLVALFASAVLLLRIRARRRALAIVLLLSGLGHIIYATLDAGEERKHGVFVNPNHLAGYLEIALAVALALLWNQVLATRDRSASHRDLATQIERAVPRLAGAALMWGAIAVGIGLTHSRGGISAAALSTLLLISLGLTQLSRKRQRKTIVTALLALVAGIGFAGLTAGREFVVRFLGSDPREIGADTRIQLWRTSLTAWRHYAWFGSGLGTFREAFRSYQSRQLEGLVEQAHSDPLQLLVTGGLIGLGLLIVATVSILWKLASAWAEREGREDSTMILAGLTAFVSLLIHGIAEFNFSIPAIPATLCVALALSVAAACETSEDRSHSRSGRRTRSAPDIIPVAETTPERILTSSE